MKRIRNTALLLVLCLLLACVHGTAFAGEQAEYRMDLSFLPSGGVAAISEGDLTVENLVLTVSNQSMKIFVGDTVTMTIVISGGDAPYTYTCRLSRKTADGEYAVIDGSESTSQNCDYRFTVPDVASFRIEVDVIDASGAVLSFATNDITPDSSLSSKVKAVVSECAPSGLSDYEKALNLYNWLCVNATYDYTYTWYSAEGVLLHGTGVCDSFASAYILLLEEAGVSCRKVVGSSLEGESHAWVLVKLGGEWYHMDPTWDESSSHRFYFGLNTALITRDHIISGLSDGGSVPETTATAYNYEMNRADGVFASVEELGALFEALPEGQSEYAFYYTGNEEPEAILDWCSVHIGRYGATSMSMYGRFLLYGELGGEVPESGISMTADGVLVSGFGLTGQVSVPADVGIVSVADGAFRDNPEMTELELPEGVTTIGADVFEGCTALTKVILPASVTSIDGDILDGIPAAVHCPNGSYAMRWAMKMGHEYVLPAGSRILSVPSGTAEIQDEAFAGNTAIRCVVVSGSLNSIGSRAFAGCTGLISINLPSSVGYIADNAFSGCTGLTVYCEAGSYAQTWCANNGVACIIL